MSWSFSVIGTPEKVAEEIEKESKKNSGQSSVEFESAKPHLIGLIQQNYRKPHDEYSLVIKFAASGSGYTDHDVEVARTCNVSIEVLYAKL